MRKKPAVAIVDDDESMRDTTKDLFDSAGYPAATFDSAQSFLASGRLSDFGCLVADMRMPGMSGLELHEHLAATGTPLPTVLVTAYPDERSRARAREAGVICYLAKPCSPEELLACVDTALQENKTRMQ